MLPNIQTLLALTATWDCLSVKIIEDIFYLQEKIKVIQHLKKKVWGRLPVWKMGFVFQFEKNEVVFQFLKGSILIWKI